MPQQKNLTEALKRLSEPGELGKAIAQLDSAVTHRRIYLMGCGRSGTWLLTSLFSSFDNVSLVAKELPIEYFGVLKTNAPVLAIKRDRHAYQLVEEIPPSIEIVWIVRHPFDVLTSHNPMESRRYYIQPWRFVGEMLALKYLVENRQAGTLVIRYEDLVQDPIGTQQRIAERFGLSIGFPPDQINEKFHAPPEADIAMHGQRKIDSASVGKFRNHPENIEHLRKIYPRVEPVLAWVAKEFSYDIALA